MVGGLHFLLLAEIAEPPSDEEVDICETLYKIKFYFSNLIFKIRKIEIKKLINDFGLKIIIFKK